jgi:UDP-2-acetamido-3-amino-2,3-dideoxy-glucuronate N-acetyltransferase
MAEMAQLPGIDAVERIALQAKSDARGTLVVGEAGRHVPFAMQRFFAVTGVPAGEARGGHAHKALQQLLVCLNGMVRVRYDDGERDGTTVLDSPDEALLIPPGIWAEQVYGDAGAVLLVLCDAPYDETDYLRDYDAFVTYRRDQA